MCNGFDCGLFPIFTRRILLFLRSFLELEAAIRAGNEDREGLGLFASQ
jgi:hypothetical protein